MRCIRRMFVVAAVMLAAVIAGCPNDEGAVEEHNGGDTTTENNEHRHEGGEHGQAGRGEHERDEGSERVIRLTISNTGCHLRAEDVDLVFDAFWRGDKARSGMGTHCGIGLTLVLNVSKLLDLEVQAEITPEAVFAIHLDLPSSTPTAK